MFIKVLSLLLLSEMIRGYVSVVSSDLPLCQVVPLLTSSTCGKATVKLNFLDNPEFSINVEGSGYSFKVK